MLKRCVEDLKHMIKAFNQQNNTQATLGIPLIASGIAAELTKKKNKTDLEYFKEYIADIFNDIPADITVVYL